MSLRAADYQGTWLSKDDVSVPSGSVPESISAGFPATDSAGVPPSGSLPVSTPNSAGGQPSDSEAEKFAFYDETYTGQKVTINRLQKNKSLNGKVGYLTGDLVYDGSVWRHKVQIGCELWDLKQSNFTVIDDEEEDEEEVEVTLEKLYKLNITLTQDNSALLDRNFYFANELAAAKAELAAAKAKLDAKEAELAAAKAELAAAKAELLASRK